MGRGKLRAGAYELDLKPEPGMMTGDGAPVAVATRTPIMARALAFDNGEAAVCIVTLDLIGIDRADAWRACALAHDKCGIDPDAVMLVASHTHVAPASLPTLTEYARFFNPSFSDAMLAKMAAWRERVVLGIAEAVAGACASLRPASVGVITTELPWLVFNRRRHTRNYGVWTHWMGIPRDQAYLPEGPIDPEFSLLVVRDEAHRPMAMLWNFTGHNSFHFDDQYAADLPYTVQQALDERMSEHVPCLYAPGCSGNTNYHDFNKPYGLDKATDEVASAIMAIYREVCTVPEAEISYRKLELDFAQRDTSQYFWKHDIEMKLPKWVDYGPRELARFQAEAREQATYNSDMSVMRIGKIGIVGVPAEMFVEFGMDIKARSPFRNTLVCSYTNDYAGYVATRRAFMGGSYEVWPTLNARIGREGGYLIVDKAAEALKDLACGCQLKRSVYHEDR